DRIGTFEVCRDAKPRGCERAGTVVEWSPDEPWHVEPRIRGAHNRENAAAATRVARELGVPEEAIAEALVSFPGVEHRLEPVAEIEGVRYVNDSKATNVTAALRALAAYADQPVRLIAGGRGKGQSFEPLADGVGAKVA